MKTKSMEWIEPKGTSLLSQISTPFTQKTARVSALAVGGLCSTPEQWLHMASILNQFGISVSIPNSPNRLYENIGERATTLASHLSNVKNRVVLLAHSEGVLEAIEAAYQVPHRVRMVVGFSTTVSGDFKLPLWSQLRLAPYALAMKRGKPFSIWPWDRSFLADGSDVTFGSESGRVLRDLAKGYPVRKLYKLHIPSFLYVGEHDHVLSHSLAYKIAYWHGYQPITVPGGHFVHCDKRVPDKTWVELCKHIHETD